MAELNFNSKNFEVTKENLIKLKKIKSIGDRLKMINDDSEFVFDFGFDIEELEKDLVIYFYLNFFVLYLFVFRRIKLLRMLREEKIKLLERLRNVMWILMKKGG